MPQDVEASADRLPISFGKALDGTKDWFVLPVAKISRFDPSAFLSWKERVIIATTEVIQAANGV